MTSGARLIISDSDFTISDMESSISDKKPVERNKAGWRRRKKKGRVPLNETGREVSNQRFNMYGTVLRI